MDSTSSEREQCAQYAEGFGRRMAALAIKYKGNEHDEAVFASAASAGAEIASGIRSLSSAAPVVDGLTLMQWSNALYEFGQEMSLETRERFKDKLGAFQDRLATVLNPSARPPQ